MRLLIAKHGVPRLLLNLIGLEGHRIIAVKPKRVLNEDVFVVVGDLGAFDEHVEVEGLVDEVLRLAVLLFVDLLAQVALAGLVGGH